MTEAKVLKKYRENMCLPGLKVPIYFTPKYLKAEVSIGRYNFWLFWSSGDWQKKFVAQPKVLGFWLGFFTIFCLRTQANQQVLAVFLKKCEYGKLCQKAIQAILRPVGPESQHHLHRTRPVTF